MPMMPDPSAPAFEYKLTRREMLGVTLFLIGVVMLVANIGVVLVHSSVLAEDLSLKEFVKLSLWERLTFLAPLMILWSFVVGAFDEFYVVDLMIYSALTAIALWSVADPAGFVQAVNSPVARMGLGVLLLVVVVWIGYLVGGIRAVGDEK